MKVTLHIDTSSSEEAAVGLHIDGKIFKKIKKYDKNKAQIVLSMMTAMLSAQKLKVNDITAIEVEVGPGSFTGLRVGVAIANSLGYFLQVPINNNPPGKLVEPSYT